MAAGQSNPPTPGLGVRGGSLVGVSIRLMGMLECIGELERGTRGGGGECTKVSAGGHESCTGIVFARCRCSGGCSGAPGGSREGAGSSPEDLRRSFRFHEESKLERSRSGLRFQRDAPSPKRRASSVRSIFRVRSCRFRSTIFRYARGTMNVGSKTLRIPAWRPFFLRSPFLSWGGSAHVAAGLSNPPTPRVPA